MGTSHARGSFICFAGLLLLLGSACGGSQDPAPGPLNRHFDDSFLLSIPVDQRGEEIKAKTDYDTALLHKGKAGVDFNEAKVSLDVAKNERDSAKLDEKSAASRAKAAQASADQNRIKEAEKEVKGAKLAADAADQRYQYLTAYRAWLKKVIRFTQHEAFWLEAKYELAQAKLAKANAIQPKGFNYDNFVKQEADRKKKLGDAKSRAESERSAAQSARTKWLALQGESDKLLGKKSQFPDPMAPNQVKGVDPSLGAGGYTPGNDGGNTGDGDGQPVQDPTKITPPDDEDDEDDEGEEDDDGESSEP